MRWLVKGCSREELRVNPGLAVGALPVVAQYDLCDVAPLLPKTRPAVRVTYSLADHQLRRIRELRESSVIALVSVSEVFLKTARGLLAPILENRHTLSEFLWPLKRLSDLRAADLVFCDSIAFEHVKHSRRVLYHLIAQSSLEYIATAMESYEKQ